MRPSTEARVLEEAQRQLAAAVNAGLRAKWLVSEEAAIEFEQLFRENDFDFTSRTRGNDHAKSCTERRAGRNG
jgi:hypothetical protein